MRVAALLAVAVQALLRGPTAAERGRGVQSAVPAGTRLLGVEVPSGAFHESADVPSYAASHGCVRVPSHDARWVYAFARFGTRVDVV